MHENRPTVTHHALLIGINDGNNAKGAINDVREMTRMLRNTRQDQSMDIQTFTTDTSVKSDASHMPLDSSHLPTFRNIVKAFDDIVSRAQPGHYLYFHFSGHGTTMLHQLTNNEYTESVLQIASSPYYIPNASTNDLALQILEDQNSNGAEFRYLRGLELAGLLRRAVDKGMMLTVVLDCCFSGSVLRNHGSGRSVLYDPEIDSRFPLDSDIAISVEGETGYQNFRGASMVAWLLNPKDYSIFTACGPSQTSRELRIGEKYHGSLSYHLLRVFDKLGRVGGRQCHIYAHVCARLGEKGAEQKPMLYGNKRLGFFESFDSPFYANPIPILHKNGTFWLEAGQAHGISVGDQFALDRLEEYFGTSDIQLRKELFEVKALESTTAELKPVGAVSIDTATSKTVTSCTTLSLRNFPIHLRLENMKDDAWRRELQNRPSLHVIIGESEPETGFSFYVTIRDKDHYEVKDTTKNKLSNIPLAALDIEEYASSVLDVMEHLTRFQMITSLVNKNPNQSFLDSFQVEIKDATGRVSYHAGCLQGIPFCSHPECVTKIRSGERVFLTVKNKVQSPERPLYAHAFDMDSRWEVENIVKGNNQVIPSRSRGTDGSWSRRIKLTVPQLQRENGETDCKDTIKVFITTRPTSFMSLELPALDEISGKTVRKVKRGEAASQTDDWAAFNFQFQTYT